MIAQYRANEEDKAIIEYITGTLRSSLDVWYGTGSTLNSYTPEIRSYRNSFMLVYPVTTADLQGKTILVKIRREPKMSSLSQAVYADIHQNVPSEYASLLYVYERMGHMEADFGAIRPLSFLEEYSAIVMEEFPSLTLRQLLNKQRSSKSVDATCHLKDAARKTGKWLYYFHHHLHTPYNQAYTSADILREVQGYVERIETRSRGRVQARPILEAFSAKLADIPIESIAFSQSHADMTSDNVLYSEDQRVCIIDIKTRPAPIYADLGLILIHPETIRPEIFTGGRYYRPSVLSQYRAEIIAGYFAEEPGNEVFARIYSAVKVLDKWLMYEELLSRYKGAKHVLSRPTAPFISAYFNGLLRKHLNLINVPDYGRINPLEETATGRCT